jgi:hypothetical protein
LERGGPQEGNFGPRSGVERPKRPVSVLAKGIDREQPPDNPLEPKPTYAPTVFLGPFLTTVTEHPG